MASGDGQRRRRRGHRHRHRRTPTGLQRRGWHLARGRVRGHQPGRHHRARHVRPRHPRRRDHRRRRQPPRPSDPQRKYIGIAPKADLIAIKASDDAGNATILDAIYGLQFAVDHKDDYNIRVVNLSLTSTEAGSYRTGPLDAAVEAAYFSGIVVVAAAGNRGADDGAADYAPGNDPFAISVGAVDDGGTLERWDDLPTDWSTLGTSQDGFARPDIAAPGAHIVSTLAGTARSPSLPDLCRRRRLHPPGRDVDGSGSGFGCRRVDARASSRLDARGRQEHDAGDRARHPGDVEQVNAAAALRDHARPRPGSSTAAQRPRGRCRRRDRLHALELGSLELGLGARGARRRLGALELGLRLRRVGRRGRREHPFKLGRGLVGEPLGVLNGGRS